MSDTCASLVNMIEPVACKYIVASGIAMPVNPTARPETSERCSGFPESTANLETCLARVDFFASIDPDPSNQDLPAASCHRDASRIEGCNLAGLGVRTGRYLGDTIEL